MMNISFSYHTSFFKIASCILFVFALSFSAKATHIVGGDFTYRCLGDNQYEITLDVYRDCFFGDTAVYFDDPAFVTLFGPDNRAIELLNLKPMGDDTLAPRVANECLFVPNTVCVHTSRYRDTVTLMPIAGGYTISYQRCCRNETINNIVQPLETGATFSIVISEKALESCNSSPVFKSYPPIYICIGEPIDWDHGATDRDGDSIVYSLCTPFNGGTIDNPKPLPVNPPYDTVVWNNGYGLNNILGSEVPMRIDPNTGFITGVPDRFGQYVVGICAREYRNGELLSVIRRDFQYNVGDCEAVAAQIGNDDVQCEDNLVRLDNQSTRADDFLWQFFDKDGVGVETSTQTNPSRLYADTGLYKIRLIAEPNTQCADSMDLDLLLKNSTIKADFETILLSCSDSTVLSTSNTSIDSVSPIASYFWTISNSTVGRSVDENPVFRLLNTGDDLEVSLVAFSSDGCKDTVTQMVDLTSFNDDQIQDTFGLCEREPIQINPTSFGADNLSYSWSPSIGLSDTTVANPTVQPLGNRTYKLKITDTNNNCQDEFDVFVAVPDENFGAAIDVDYLSCDDEDISLQFADASNGGNLTLNGQRTWRLSTGETSTEPNISIDAASGDTIEATLRIETAEGCVDQVTERIAASQLNLNVNFLYENCTPGDILIRFRGTDMDSNFTINSYNWVFSNGEVSNAPEPRLPFADGEEINAKLTVTTEEGCDAEAEDNLQATGFNPVPLAGSRTYCEGEAVQLNPDGDESLNYTWLPSQLLDDPNSTNPTATLSADTVLFTAIISDPNLPGCESAEDLTLLPAIGIVNPDFNVAIDNCKPTVTLNLEDNSTIENGTIEGLRWELSDGRVSDEEAPTFEFEESQQIGINLSVLTNEGCVETLSIEDSLSVNLSTVEDVRVSAANAEIVAGDTVFLIGFTTQPNVDYTWLPEGAVSDPTASEVTTIAEEGDSDFILNVIDENGCEATTTFRFTALANQSCVEPNIFIPSAFTPNGDADNPLLFVYGRDITEMELLIYNRWGERVFRTTQQEIGWDGTFNGEELEPNVYGYYLRAVCGNGKVYTKKGNVSILR